MPNQNVTEAEFIRMLVVGITGKDLLFDRAMVG